MRHVLNLLLLLVSAAPFVLPPSAVVREAKAEGGGWRQSGEMPLSYRQTRAQFAARFAAAGWRHRHDIALAKGRTVEAWERGGETLTFLSWSIAPDRTGFSWGVSAKGGKPEAPGENPKGTKIFKHGTRGI